MFVSCLQFDKDFFTVDKVKCYFKKFFLNQLVFVASPPNELSCAVSENWFVVGKKLGKLCYPDEWQLCNVKKSFNMQLFSLGDCKRTARVENPSLYLQLEKCQGNIN